MIKLSSTKKLIAGFSLSACFFLITYYILHEYNANYGLIKPVVATKLLLFYSGIAISIFTLAWLFFRQYDKSSAFTFIVVCLFLFFGSIHDSLKAETSNSFLRSHTFIFSLLLIFLITIFLFIKRKTSNTGPALKGFSFLSLTLLLWETVILFFNIGTQKEKSNMLVKQTEKFINLNKTSERPDIFYIVLDAYTSSSCLSDDFGYSNAAFDSMLSAKGFFIASHSVSNYPVTPFSIASCMGMNYLDIETGSKAISAKKMLQGAYSVKESQVPQLLEEQGYSIYNYSIFNLKRYPARVKGYFDLLSERMIDEQTVWGRFKKNLIWNFIFSTGPGGRTEITEPVRKMRSDYIEDYIENNIQGLINSANQPETNPKFVYCHIMLPHEPYYFMKEGDFWPDSLVFDKTNRKERFLQQTIYTNKRINLILDSLMKDRKRPYIIILQGDHGFRDFESKADRNKIFKNLSAFYFSDRDYKLLYDSVSNVNTFRIVLNKYFNAKLNLLKDSSVYLRDPSFSFEK